MWYASRVNGDARVFVTSDDYGAGVRMYVNSEGTPEQKMIYACEVATRLNEQDKLWTAMVQIKQMVTPGNMNSAPTLIMDRIERIAIEALGEEPTSVAEPGK